jgi:hypothetical protein
MDTRFKKKTVFHPLNSAFSEQTPVLIWYSGDENAAQLFSHGNSKCERPYLPVARSVRPTIKAGCQTNSSIGLVFEKLSGELQQKNRKLFRFFYNNSI